MDIDSYMTDLRTRLSECPLTRDQLAHLSGGAISASWLSKFAAGHMSNPRIDSLRTLDHALASCGAWKAPRQDEAA
jgi:hypothetical protein